MSFIPQRYDCGRLYEVVLDGNDSAMTKGDALERQTSGKYRRAGSGSTRVDAVAWDTRSSVSDGDTIVAVDPRDVEFKADTANDTSQSDEGKLVDLSDQASLDQATTTNTVFQIKKTIGAAGDRKVSGYFVIGTDTE